MRAGVSARLKPILPRPARRAIGAADLAAYRFLRVRLHHPVITPKVARFSRLGEHAGLWLAIGGAGALVDRPRRREWLRATATIGTAYAVNTAVKGVIGRKRPAFEEMPLLARTPTQLSFPSAHATSSFCAAEAFRPLLPTRPLYATATAMAVSRVHLGVHFPSDVVAGAVLGTVVGRIAGRRA